MDEKDLQELKSKLLAEKKRLEDELSRVSTKDKILKDDYDAKFPNYGDSVEDNAAEVADFDTNLSLEGNFEVALLKVNRALKNINDGTYGHCAECGREISLDRLNAIPWAEKCLECQRKNG